MNDKLPNEVRMKVAEECGHAASIDYAGNVTAQYGKTDFLPWRPDAVLMQKDALTRTAARLIADIQLRLDREHPDDYIPPIEAWQILGLAIAADDTDFLERFVAELKGFV